MSIPLGPEVFSCHTNIGGGAIGGDNPKIPVAITAKFVRLRRSSEYSGNSLIWSLVTVSVDCLSRSLSKNVNCL